IWINFGWFNKSSADLKSFAPPNPNYLVTNARLRAASPTLFVYCGATLSRNLPVCGPAAPKLFRQWLVGTAFLAASLSPSARFYRYWRHQVADKRQSAFYV